MKKETKKKLEQELITAVEAVLAKHNSKGIAKTKKAIKTASKSVAKKFNKVLKAIVEKKQPVAKAKKKPAIKPVSKKTLVVKRSKPKKINKAPVAVKEFVQPVIAVEGRDQQNS